MNEKPTPITVVNTNPMAISTTGFRYSKSFSLETCVPSTNKSGAMTAIIKTSGSNLKCSGMGKMNSATPKAI